MTTTPVRRALLVGIDAYPNVTPLNGCVNDVNLMRAVLIETFGFSADHITQLTNQQATRDGMLAALDALVAATGPDDIVLFHFAGHGSRIADREGDEPSGFDSTIVPFDAARPGGAVLDITDDEINLRLEGLAQKTALTTLVFDACHSGTITRDDFGERARSIEADDRPISELPASPIPPDARQRTRAAGPSGWMPLADRYVLIAGCRDEERSYEYRPPEGGGKVVHGALTYFLCQQLRRLSGSTSYRDVFERTATLVNALNGAQHPQIEGRTDREVFGLTDVAPAAFVRVLEREDQAVLLAAGAAHGMTVGSTYRVFPQGARDPKASGSIGEVEIIEVQSVTALARISREDPPGGIGPDARAFEQAHAFGDQRLSVVFAHADDVDGRAQALRLRLDGSRLVTMAAAGAQACACIYRLPARDALSPSSPVPQVGALAEPRWAVVGATGDLLMPLKALDEVDGLVENLECIAKYRQALAIENPDALSRLRGQFTVELQTLGGDRKTWTVATPAADSGQIAFDDGDIIRVVIRSRHDAPVFVSLYDFGLSGAIGQIYPARGAQEMLRAQGELACRAQQLGFPPMYPAVEASGGARVLEGVETVKLFVTEQATDFSAFEQDGLRTDAASSPLSALLASVFHGRPMRDLAPVSLGDEDWTTVSVPFVLRRRAKES